MTGTATRLRPQDPLGVLLYAYAIGVRSCRQLERRCHEDLAFRVLAANQTPDHVTIARFRARYAHALAGLLVDSLQRCAAAGMVRVGTVALDGTKLAGNAAEKANRTHNTLDREVAEILRQAAAADQRDGGEHGDARGDELPAALASKAGRLERLRQATAQLEAAAAEPSAAPGSGSPSWRPRPAPRASTLGRTASPGRETRHPTPSASSWRPARSPTAPWGCWSTSPSPRPSPPPAACWWSLRPPCWMSGCASPTGTRSTTS